MITRRNAMMALGAGALAAPLGAFAQQPGKVWRVGYLSSFAGPDETVDALRETLTKLGYVEGRNISYEYRWSAGRDERLPQLADELVRARVDVIVARTGSVAMAAKRATSTIPIVIEVAGDPVGMGLIASLARPGGNVTGVSQNATELDGKRLQLLREVVPKATRVAMLVWDKSATKAAFIGQMRAAAKQMNITLLSQEVSGPEGFEAAFAAMQRERAQGLVVQTSGPLIANAKRVADLAARHRLAAMYQNRFWMDAGGLIYYGASSTEMHRQAASYVDRILKGAKPADLPVEEPTQYELVVNLKTARALGLTIPQAVLLRAEVIN